MRGQTLVGTCNLTPLQHSPAALYVADRPAVGAVALGRVVNVGIQVTLCPAAGARTYSVWQSVLASWQVGRVCCTHLQKAAASLAEGGTARILSSLQGGGVGGGESAVQRSVTDQRFEKYMPMKVLCRPGAGPPPSSTNS